MKTPKTILLIIDTNQIESNRWDRTREQHFEYLPFPAYKVFESPNLPGHHFAIHHAFTYNPETHTLDLDKDAFGWCVTHVETGTTVTPNLNFTWQETRDNTLKKLARFDIKRFQKMTDAHLQQYPMPEQK